MKISKESHRKTGVGVSEQTGTIGLLYKNPLDKHEKIEDVVKQRANSTKRLYNLFGTGETSKDISKNAKEVAKVVNRAIGSLKFNMKNNQRECIDKELKSQQVISAIEKSKKYDFKENDVDEALDRLLKKSFRQAKSKNALRKLLMSTLVDNKALSTDDIATIQNDFVKKLVADYNKSNIKNNIPKALRNQNMVVQPDSSGILSLSQTRTDGKNNKTKDIKISEKDAFRQFLSDYAVLDDEVRHQLRLKLRRLVDLYFYGEDTFIKDDFDEWKVHEDNKSNTEPFVTKVTVKKNTKDNKEFEILNVDATADVIRSENISRYRQALDYVNSNKQFFFTDEMLNKFWIHHIESEVERIYKRINAKTGDYKFQRGYLSEKVWKGIINYLSIKYIAEGKAVYNYAMTALSLDNDSKEFGKLDERVSKGISSFEYERIKAEETLQRECAVYVAFAANHLANATVVLDDVNTDFLLLKNKELDAKAIEKGEKSLAECAKAKPDTLRNILQFFGGQSSWKDFDFTGCDEIQLLDDLKEMIYSLRNSSFHFKTENIADNVKNKDLINAMFAFECVKAGTVQKNKMYSNNVSVFYSETDIEKLLGSLYSRINERASQVPSFNTVFVRKNFPEYLKNQKLTPAFTQDDILKWQSAVYYLYKEIYYNGFLQDKTAFDLLTKYVRSLDENCADKQQASANKDFKVAFELYSKSGSLSETCQMIMTEYNNQNKGNRVGISARTQKADRLIFQHYKMILFAGLQSAFTEYIKAHSDIYGFIFKPAVKENIPEVESFLPNYRTNQYNELVNLFKEEIELQKWYITGRLLNSKQVNQLIGSFRSYKQYVYDVVRRAKENGNQLINAEISVDADNIIKVLDVCTKLNGVTSNCLEDYFADSDEYAKYIGRFIDFGLKKGEELANEKLASFCQRELGDRKVGTYHDGINPILNRNVIQCKLYGASDIISKAGILPVDYEIIKKYIGMTKDINGYQESGVCVTKDDQQKLKKYQELKNMVELRNIVEYSEIINELQGQLINWGYLRERDLMYFQLGFHYLCLKNSSDKPEGYDKAGEMIGTILYQIVAMYTNGLSMVDAKGKSKRNAKASAGKKLESFFSYSAEMTDNKYGLYLAGLELFENVSEHDQCVKLRNDIEHFHYYAVQDRSMLDMYSEVFDRFFTYDMKYAKNVPNMLYNILLQHLVVPNFQFGTGKKQVGDKNKQTKSRATILLAEKNGLASEKFTYKLDGGKSTVMLSAKSNDFLSDVAAILYYPDSAPKMVVRDTVVEDEKASKKCKGKGNYKENNKHKNNGKDENKKGDNKKGNYNNNNNKQGNNVKADDNTRGNHNINQNVKSNSKKKKVFIVKKDYGS